MAAFVRSILALATLSACTATVKGELSVKPNPGVSAPEPAAEAPDTSPALPLDPAVKTGTLSNGLTYFIRKHQKPEKRAMLWLAVNAGSVLEDDNQRGLAHFVEHMAFNGTERFEKNTIIDFFEKSGMDFGADVNAYTSFDETVYMLQVPTDDATLLKTGFDVLEDWAGAVTFDPVEVDKERGVVIEEWRLGRGASQRVFDKQWPIFLAGSKYAKRQPIGEKKILETAPVERISSFYKDWYRPDNMAVIVVGDIEPAAIEKEIDQRFGDLKNPANPRERVNVPVPLLDDTRIDVQTDSEMTLTQVSLAIKGPRADYRTENDHRRDLVDELFHGMLRGRLQELGQRPDSPFAFAFSFTNEMGRAVDVFRMFAAAKPNMAEAAAESLLTELERVRQHGFVESELQRAKAEYLRDLQRAVAEADTTDASSYAKGLANHFLEGETMITRAHELKLADKYLAKVSLQDTNALAQQWTSRKDRVISAAGASTDAMPSEKTLLAMASSVVDKKVEPWKDSTSDAALMAAMPKAGTITKTETLDKLGVTVWTLSNGARVVVKPTDFKSDEVVMTAFSPGGHSLASDDVFGSAEFAASIVSDAGVGPHDPIALRNLLAGKAARVSPWINELEEGMSGSASPKDLETMMQLTHLYFTEPRKSEPDFQTWKGQMGAFLANRSLNPQSVFFDEITKVATSGHKRRLPSTVERIEAIDLSAAHDFYRQRFASAGDFTFVFVGNVDQPRLKELAATYLASLPAVARKDKWKDVGVVSPRGTKKVRIAKGKDPKSFVMLAFHGAARWTADAEDDMDMLGDVLGIRLREILREDKGGVYGVFSGGQITRRPKGKYAFQVGFGCAPDNAEMLTKSVFDYLDALGKDGVDAATIDKIKEQRRRSLETAYKENGFWLRQLATHYRFGTDPSAILGLSKRVDRVSSKRVKAAAKKYLRRRQYIDGLLSPEATPAK